MTTARAWLVERNLAKEGARGRFSLDAKNALEDALRDGVIFEDYGPEKATKTSHKATSRRTRRPVRPKPKPQATMDVADPVYSESAKFYGWVDGKKVQTSFKEVCSHSGVSLAYCTCVFSGLFAMHRAIVGKYGSQDVEVDGV